MGAAPAMFSCSEGVAVAVAVCTVADSKDADRPDAARRL